MNELTKAGEPARKAYQRRLPSDNTKDYYFIHRNTGVTEPIIIEYGFIDNAKDAARIRNNYKKYAEAVVKAVAQTKGYNYKTPNISDRYIVQRGDTLWSIAKKLDTTVNELKSANNLNNNMLYINQELIVPNYETVEDSNISYVVKKGDTLWSISKEYGVSVNDLKNFNNLTNDFLSTGQILVIPSSNQIITSEEEQETIIAEGSIYEVQAGDTLYSISRKFNIPLEDIINQNNLSSTTLSIGTKLLIPNVTDDIQVYVVQKGDSLWALARQFNTTINEIKELNNLTSDILTIGSELQIKKNTNN